MGIFEQYGIKEVADVTIYAITENKYGEEIYVPLVYFDTLKVSDIEQAAEQTSARGGLGNSHQIFWDYNKEVTVKLTDALYTPSSQSLTWGNYLGIKPLELQGIWTPESFEIQKNIVDEVPQGEEEKYIKFICPCDGTEKYYTYIVRVLSPAQQITQEEITYKNNRIQLDGKVLENVQSYSDDFDDKKQKSKLIIKNFLNFSQSYAEYSDEELISHWRLFNWEDCEGEIISNSETIAIDDIDLAVFNNENTDNKMFLIKKFSSQNEGWSSKFEVYKTVYKKLIGLGENNQPTEKFLALNIHIGDFYIVEDWNINNYIKETIPYQIDLNYKEIPFLNSIKKEQAKKDFKIDTNKNILAYNAFFIKGYEKNNLSCYIDPNTMKPYSPNESEKVEGTPTSYHYFKKGEYYLKKTRAQSSDTKKFLSTLVAINQYNGLFKIVGETYSRNRFGEDSHYQIEIPRCKMQTSNSLNLSPDGEANTVNMSFIALPDYNGKLISITQYEEEIKEEYKERYTRPIITQKISDIPFELHLSIIYPNTTNGGTNPGILCVPNDCRVANPQSYSNGGSRLILPINDAAARNYYNKIQNDKWEEIPRDLLLVGVYNRDELLQFLTQSDNCTITIKNLEVEQG